MAPLGVFTGTFKFVCIGDGNILDVPHSITRTGTKVVTFSIGHGGDNQRWIGKACEFHGYLATALSAKGSTPIVLDESATNPGEVVLWPLHGGPNQLWASVRVECNPEYVLIKNIGTGHCLRSAGNLESVECVEENHNDRNQWWKWTFA